MCFICNDLNVFFSAGELFANTKKLLAKWKNILEQYLSTEDDQVMSASVLYMPE
jgi:hypothetical protein